VLSAPAGFGKTVLASEWLRASDDPGFGTAWVSLDESDNDLARFLRHLVAALGESRTGIGGLGDGCSGE
jgi:LuxR family maltose regulon positive regulatory protein